MDPNENTLSAEQRTLTPAEMTAAIKILEADSRRIRPLLAVSVVIGLVNVALKLFLPFGLPAHLRQTPPVGLTSTPKANLQP